MIITIYNYTKRKIAKSIDQYKTKKMIIIIFLKHDCIILILFEDVFDFRIPTQQKIYSSLEKTTNLAFNI